MKPADEIRQLFKNAELGIDPNVDEKVFEDVFGAHKETTENTPAIPEIWRIIMKSRKAQFTAAAVAVLATYLCLQIPGLVAPAYALQDTIEASNSIRYLHAKAFWTVSKEWDFESWIEFDEDGKPAGFRLQASRVSSDKRLGPATFVYDGDKSQTWMPNLNLCFRRSGKSVSTGALLQWMPSDVDPKLICEKLRQQARDGEIILDVNEPDQKNEPIVLVVTYPAESRSVNWKKVLYIDQATRLVKKEEKFEMRSGQYQHVLTTEFFDYNQKIDPQMFSLDKVLPENVIMIDQSSKEVGLAQGDMTDEEIAAEVTSQFAQTAIARDFDKAGQLFYGMPGYMVEKLLGVNVLKIISVGPVHRDPDPDLSQMICSGKTLGEIGGQYYEFDSKIYVVPVSGQPGRWMICRIDSNPKPASGEIIQEE
ncbi:outer membrane lipoprotein carrier protein LolA [Planctomycetota bacterium]